MVTSGAYDWTEWGTAATAPLYGDELDANFDFLRHIVVTGIGSDNVENGAIALPAFLGNNCVVDAALDLGCAGDGAHVIQGGAWATTGNTGQKMVFGTVAIESNAAVTQEGDASFAIAYNAGVGCTDVWAGFKADNPAFINVVCPQAGVTQSGATTVVVHITNVGTTQVQGWCECTDSFSETLYWMAAGAVVA